MSARASRRSRVLRYLPGARLVSRGRREDGIALVEFALVLPVLLAVLTGILQFGLMFNRYITLTDAVRAGARTASLGRGLTNPCDPAVDQTVSSALDIGLTTGAVTVTPGGTSTCSGASGYPYGSGGNFVQGDAVTVTAHIPYAFQIFGVSFGTIQLTAHATDPIE
jgi:TadE-like protein